MSEAERDQLLWLEQRVEASGDRFAAVVPAAAVFPAIRQGVFLIADRLDESEGGIAKSDGLAGLVKVSGEFLEMTTDRIADLKA